jgi:(heptosyl)LPS beta-1,4-glucosyltransferase
MGARVVHEPFRGYGTQRRLSIEACTGEWVLALDADEAVTPELRESIVATLATAETPHAGFELERHTHYLGTWFGSRGWRRDRIVRLVRKDRVVFDERIIWERLAVDGSTARLSGPLLHWTYRDVSHHMEKMALYSSMKAAQMFDSGRRCGFPGAVLHSAGRFVSGYLLGGGFLYGWPGLVFDLLGAHGTLLAYLKLSEMSKNESGEGERRESNPRPPGPQPGALTD